MKSETSERNDILAFQRDQSGGIESVKVNQASKVGEHSKGPSHKEANNRGIKSVISFPVLSLVI